MDIAEFHYHRPATLREACEILAGSPDAAPLAGGTDLLVEMKQGLRRHRDIVSLGAISELKVIRHDQDHLWIGAGVTHNEVAGHGGVQGFCPAVAEAASQIGTDQIRNVGTLGGNLCTGASCCDMAPILVALEAVVEIRGTDETRRVSLDDFFVAHRETRLKRGEVMTGIILTRPPAGSGAAFEKFGLREAASVSVASVAAAIQTRNGHCSETRIVIGAVAPTPKVSLGAGRTLEGRSTDELFRNPGLLEQAGTEASADCRPIDDLRGSAEYRRHLIKILTQRAVLRALARIKP